MMDFEPVKEAIPDGLKIERNGEKVVLCISAMTIGKLLKCFGLGILCIFLIPFSIAGVVGSLSAGAPLGVLFTVIVVAGAVYFIKRKWSTFYDGMKIEIDNTSVSFSGKRYDINHWDRFIPRDATGNSYIEFYYGGKREKTDFFFYKDSGSEIILYINRMIEELQAPRKEMPVSREQKF